MPGYPEVNMVDSSGNILVPALSTSGDGTASPVPADAVLVWNGTTYDRLREPTADTLAATGVAAVGAMVWNGSSFDRLKGSNGAVNTLSQAAFPVYTETAVVDGARISNGNITGGSIPNNASIFLVSVNLSVLTGTNVQYSLQVQDANTNWLTVGSTAVLTATGQYGFSVGPGMTNGNVLPSGNGNWRVSWTVTATTHVTSQIGVTGR